MFTLTPLSSRNTSFLLSVFSANPFHSLRFSCTSKTLLFGSMNHFLFPCVMELIAYNTIQSRDTARQMQFLDQFCQCNIRRLLSCLINSRNILAAQLSLSPTPICQRVCRSCAQFLMNRLIYSAHSAALCLSYLSMPIAMGISTLLLICVIIGV